MRNRNFKYHLRKGSRKERCPSCGHPKCFVPYVDDNNVPAGRMYGRCERINSCRYISYPARSCDEANSYMTTYRHLEPVVEQKPDYVSKRLVEQTRILRPSSNSLHTAFESHISQDFNRYLYEAFIGYNVGRTRSGGTIFWQQDKEGMFRTGKVIHYDPKTGKRIKDKGTWYVHKQVKYDFNLVQVFFGEHLIPANPDMPIALCESEKTALIMSIFEPDYIWLATGGAEMINTYRLSRLPRLDIIFPDNGQSSKWRRKTAIFNPKCDMSVDNAVMNGILKPGSDILDLYLLQREKDTI